jgi:HK97 family phage major capsid protein
MAYEIVQAGVKTIAVWMPITRQILADAPQLESEIDSFEREDLELALEEEIISGTGGTHFTGLENTPGITPQAFDTDLLTTTRKARTTAMVVGRAKSNAFLLNPYDWETLDLTRNATAGNFYFGGPMVMGMEQLWGLPVIQSEVIPKATGYTGNLKLIRLWDREQATRRITDSHSDFFTHNLIAILTELRAAMGVKRPAGIVKMDFQVGANS